MKYGVSFCKKKVLQLSYLHDKRKFETGLFICLVIYIDFSTGQKIGGAGERFSRAAFEKEAHFLRSFRKDGHCHIEKDGYRSNPYLQSGCYNARELKKPNAKVRKIAFTINSELKQLGLFGKHSYDKFIPECYKYASVKDRLALLQGLMDTDGHCMKSNKDIFSGTEFSTISERLSDDVAELVQSLGGIVRKHSKKPFYTKNGVHVYCKTAYRLNIKMPSQLIPFRLKRKISAYHIPQKYDVARFIKDDLFR